MHWLTVIRWLLENSKHGTCFGKRMLRARSGLVLLVIVRRPRLRNRTCRDPSKNFFCWSRFKYFQIFLVLIKDQNLYFNILIEYLTHPLFLPMWRICPVLKERYLIALLKSCAFRFWLFHHKNINSLQGNLSKEKVHAFLQWSHSSNLWDRTRSKGVTRRKHEWKAKT